MTIYYIVTAILIFFMGASFGSFLSLARYRLPLKQDIVFKRSYCPKCKHNLEFFDLIPVISFLSHKRRCKYCKEIIPIRYIFLELSHAIIALILFIVCWNYFSGTVLFVFPALIVIAILIVYTFIHLLIFSFIKYQENEKKLRKQEMKKGVFIQEVIIAFAIFIVFVTSSYYINRNYTSLYKETYMKNEAMNLAMQKIEDIKLQDYYFVDSESMQKNINGDDYTINVTVTKYSDIDISKEDVIKKVEVKVEYDFDGESKEYKLESLKWRIQ